MALRDDFSAKTKRTLAERAAYHCSNPICRATTSGPEAKSGGSLNVGEAAHITAASPGGCRYDSGLSSEQRSAIDNGIWLCARCATLIDKECDAYPLALLREWKRHAEDAARKGIEAPGTFASGQSNAYTVASLFRHSRPSKFFEIQRRIPPPGKRYYEPVNLVPLCNAPERMPTGFQPEILLDASLGPSPSSCAFVLQLHNVGTGTEAHASITLRIDGPEFWKQTVDSPSRIATLTEISEHKRSSVAGFNVANLAPGELYSSRIYSHKPGPFNVEAFSSSTAGTINPFVFDVVFEEPQLDTPPPEDPEFEKSHFPFS